MEETAKDISAVTQIAQKHDWSWKEHGADMMVFTILMPSGREFGFQVKTDNIQNRIFDYVTAVFDQDAYVREAIQDHPDWSVLQVLYDSQFVQRKLHMLAEDIQPWEYNHEAHLNRILMEAEQLGWRVYQNIAESGSTVVLSKEIADKRNYSFTVNVQSAEQDITSAVAGFDSKVMACTFASIYGGRLPVTGEQIPMQWRQLADMTFSALMELDAAVQNIAEHNPVKNLWMRCGVTFRLSAWEYSEVCRMTSLGQEILKRKFELGDCHLDGETYAPDNRTDAAEGEWKHDEFGFDF